MTPDPADVPPEVVVVGAGIAGLAAAHVLAEAGLSVLVLEKSDVVGGKCTSYVDEQLGYTVEHGIHGVFPRYRNLRALWADAGIPDSLFSATHSTGMADAAGRMHSTALAPIAGGAPWFLLRMVPKGVLRLRDFLFAARFLLRTYAANSGAPPELDDTTFGGLVRSLGVSERMKRVLLLPYVRNLTYARGDEVSAQLALEALGYYVVEDAEAVKARWIDGGPSAVIFAPWQAWLERRGVRFALGTAAQGLLLRSGRVAGVLTAQGLGEHELGTTPKTWIGELGHHRLGLTWEPEKKRLTALSAQCTHKGCPLGLVLEGTPHYQCPCHGAQFDLEGKVLRAPASEPLAAVPLHHDPDAQAYFVAADAPRAGGASPQIAGSVAATFTVLALDIRGAQAVLPKSLRLGGSTGALSLLRTTSVIVLRMCFASPAGRARWSGPDSGVFAEADVLDNYFALHTFQREFAAREELVLECHIGDSERFDGLDDGSVYAEALSVLDRYFPAEQLSQRIDRARCRLLRHDGVFALAAPGDRARTPQVSHPARPELMLAGDWVLPDDPAHRGFFMERAAITGIAAANAILRQKGRNQALRPIVAPPLPLAVRALGFPVRLLGALRRAFRRALRVD